MTVCSRMDCILGPHWSRSEKMRVSSRLTPSAVDEGVGDVLQEAAHQVVVDPHADLVGGPVPALGLLPHLVDDDVVHQGGLAHAGAGDVEVVPGKWIFRGVPVVVSPTWGPPRTLRAVGSSVLAPDSRRVPQAGRLADCHHAALAEGSGTTGRTRLTLRRAPAGLS